MSLRDRTSLYEVAEVAGRHVKLRCVRFDGEDDLGDGIINRRLHADTWVSLFHAWKFVEHPALTQDNPSYG